MRTCRHALRRRVIAAKPFSVRLDGDRFQVEQAAHGILRAAGLVEAEMPVLAEAENDDVESAGLGDLAFVCLNAGERIGFQRADGVKLRGRNPPRLLHATAHEVRAIAWLFERHAHVFIQREDVQMRELQPAFADATVEFDGRIARRNHDVAGRRCGEPSRQAIGGSGIGDVRRWMGSRHVH